MSERSSEGLAGHEARLVAVIKDNEPVIARYVMGFDHSIGSGSFRMRRLINQPNPDSVERLFSAASFSDCLEDRIADGRPGYDIYRPDS